MKGRNLFGRLWSLVGSHVKGGTNCANAWHYSILGWKLHILDYYWMKSPKLFLWWCDSVLQAMGWKSIISLITIQYHINSLVDDLITADITKSAETQFNSACNWYTMKSFWCQDAVIPFFSAFGNQRKNNK